jgi:AraC family transcriptional regulator
MRPTFEQQWVEVMLTSSTAERSTLCADYEIGLQLEPQEVHPSVRYGARRRGRAGHMSFGQTWSATKGAMNNIVYSTVQIAPAEAVRRRKLAWHGMAVESIEAPGHNRIEYRFHASINMLAMYDQGIRRGGETAIDGMPPSTIRNFARKLTLVPAGHDFRDLHEESTLTRMMYFYFDPVALQMPSDAGVGKLVPQLLFEDSTLWSTALKLKRAIESHEPEPRLYSEALAVVLMHELLHRNRDAPRADANSRGGLAAWQKRKVTSYIEEHLTEQISLTKLAELARLSPYHFCRAFKQSFGTPPHRYHISRRIERAKVLLIQRSVSITEIGLDVGFNETGAFISTFRKATGLTPRGFRRSLE